MSRIKNLNQVLFAQLERLNSDTLSGEALQNEIARTEAITDISKQVINAGALAVSAEKLRQDYRGPASSGTPKLLEDLT